VIIARQRLRHRDRRSRLERRFEFLWLAVQGPALEREFRFHPTRKWRSDFAHIPSRTLIEIEGGIWINGRHNRAPGFIADMEKYNEATLGGWRVFRLTDVHLTLKLVGRISEFVNHEVEKFQPTQYMK
jgi:hypothetical protein